MKTMLREQITWTISIIVLLYIFIVYTIKPQSPAVFLPIIISMIPVVIKLRFKNHNNLFYLDLIVLFILSLYWEEGIYLLLPTIFLIVLQGRWLFNFVVLPYILFTTNLQSSVVVSYLSVLLIGYILYIWEEEKSNHYTEIDRYRNHLYMLEENHAYMLQNQSEISRIATLSERDRIAQKLHDDLGHELTAGLLSLKAHKITLNDQLQEDKRLNAAISRLENAAGKLKDTVHNTKSLTTYGLEAFEDKIKKSPITLQYDKSGTENEVAPHIWQALNGALQEGLTNMLKYAANNEGNISLVFTPNVARLEMSNPTDHQAENQSGFGLKFMRKSIEHLKGSLSVQKTFNTFKIIIVLPLKEDQYENHDRR